MLHHVPGRRSQRASSVLSALTWGFPGRFIADGDSSESSFPYAFSWQLVSSLPRRLASVCSRGGWLPELGGRVFLWQFSPRCGILPHCFSGETMTCPAVPVPFRREEKFRCQISPSPYPCPDGRGA